MKLSLLGAFLLALLALTEGQLQLDYDRGSVFSRGKSQPKYQEHKFNPKFTPDPQYLLKHVVEPEHYTVEIRPIIDLDDGFEQYTAPGRVSILVTALNATNEIMMHHHPTMNISNVGVVEEGQSAQLFRNTTYQEENHFLTIQLTQNLAIDRKYIISMDFVAKIWQDKTDGLYLAKYKEKNGTALVDKQMVSTQFESIAARQAFPCFDEPRFKSSFTFTIFHKQSYKAWCNSVPTTIPDPDNAGWLQSNFADTAPVRLPTYLVAIIVADYDCALAPNTTMGPEYFEKPAKVCGRPDAINERNGGELPAAWSSKIINWLQERYNYTYELPKIDSMALPEAYFGGGAMENWGLNTYREPYLLYYTGDSTESNRQTILSILTHELAHQWFGNLVTCNWWSQIWLNEGFATYVSFEGVAKLFPEYGLYLDEMLWESVQYALAYDVGRDDPVINNAETIEEVDNVFGTVTYDKGGSLLRMMVGFMTEEGFTNGVRAYLKDNAYKAAEQDQLFAALQPFAANLPDGSDLKTVMDTWTLRPGYPLVRVSRLGGNLLLSQEVYGPASGPTRFEEYANELWEVPIVIASADDATAPRVVNTTWLKKNEVLKPFSINANSAFVHVNPDGSGYYRVIYEESLFRALIRQVVSDPDSVTYLSRSQLIDDYFSFASYGHATIKEAMETTKYMNTAYVETNNIVWNTVFTNLNKALTVLRFREELSGLQGYLGPIIIKTLESPNITMLPLEPMEGTKAIFRAKLVDWAVALGESKVINLATELVRNYTASNQAVSADLAQVLYCPAIQADETLFDPLLRKLATIEVDPVPYLEVTRIINGLACTTNPVNQQLLLGEALQDDSVLSRFTVALYQRMATRSPVHRDAVLNYLDSNLDEFIAHTSVDDAIRVVNTVINAMTQESDKARILQFQELHKEELNNWSLSLDGIDINVEWYERNNAGLQEWFSEQ